MGENDILVVVVAAAICGMVVDPDKPEDLTARGATLSGGGFDLSCEATGSPPTIQQSLDPVKRGAAVPATPTPGSGAAPPRRARRIDGEPIITGRLPRARAAEALQSALRRPAGNGAASPLTVGRPRQAAAAGSGSTVARWNSRRPRSERHWYSRAPMEIGRLASPAAQVRE